MPNTPDIDVSALAEALNEKLDRDGGNATNAIKEMMAHMGMPSDRYIDLTLPASGGTVTAPDDGYLILYKTATAQGQYTELVIESTGMRLDKRAVGAQNELSSFMPVSKNQRVAISYNAAGAARIFRFVYANGNQHLAS